MTKPNPTRKRICATVFAQDAAELRRIAADCKVSSSRVIVAAIRAFARKPIESQRHLVADASLDE